MKGQYYQRKQKKKVYAVFQSAQCCLWFIVAVMSIQLSNKRLWEALAWFRRLVFVSSHSTFTKPPWDINSNFYFKILASIWRHFSYKDRIIYEALFHVALMLLKYGELGSNQEIVFSLHTESKTKKNIAHSWGWRDNKGMKSLVLHMATPGLISGTTHNPLSSTPEHRAKNTHRVPSTHKNGPNPTKICMPGASAMAH